MAKPIRVQRIADRIREKLLELIVFQVSDPRLVGVTITDVTVDRELAYANIYVFAAEGSERRQDVLEGLRHAEGFLRHELIHTIDLRSFPQLRFKWDATSERAERIEELFTVLRNEKPPTKADEAGTGDE